MMNHWMFEFCSRKCSDQVVADLLGSTDFQIFWGVNFIQGLPVLPSLTAKLFWAKFGAGAPIKRTIVHDWGMAPRIFHVFPCFSFIPVGICQDWLAFLYAFWQLSTETTMPSAGSIMTSGSDEFLWTFTAFLVNLWGVESFFWYGFVWKCWVNIPNYSHLIGIMIINHWVQWGTLFSDTRISKLLVGSLW